MLFLNFQVVVVVLFFQFSTGKDYYELLGVPKNANDREIRKAFKRLAVTMHPDKNQVDPDAHEKFVHLTKAYEVLKDAESRKKYDLYGEEGIKSSHQQTYHSWSYYRDNFGIYDDDPEIVTLNKADFDQSVLNSHSLWFINFYSPMCSHCHELAPTWRRLARELEGVIRIGAVNCEDDWVLCRQEGIRSYPSLFVYPAREKYDGERGEDNMQNFVLSRLKVTVVKVDEEVWKHDRGSSSWLLILCQADDGSCLDAETSLKLAAILEGLVMVGQVDCHSSKELCGMFGATTESCVIYWEPLEQHPVGVTHRILGTDTKDIAKEVLSFLPEPSELDAEGFNDVRNELKNGSPYPWVIYFYLGETTADMELELKKLPALLPDMRLGKVHCGRWTALCRDLHVSRYPLFAVFKRGGGYEIHHGRETAHDVANFARDSSAAPNIRVLAPPEFPDLLHSSHESGAWLVDFYAPWCPPCLRLLPELRKASRHFDSAVNFGTVDCTIHAALCRQHNIRSYPTTILYNNTEKQQFLGDHTATSVVDFLQDFLNPIVVKLTKQSFYSSVGNKSPDELWIVDFFASWCGPCQQLAPEWRKLAKMVSSMSNIHVGAVDCEVEISLCRQQGVRSYPTIRLYPLGGRGLSTIAIYSGYQRDVHSLRQWLFGFIPSKVEELTPDSFQHRVLDSDEPWLVDFYAPWCGHCVVFAPEFQIIAQKLEGRVLAGKVNCNAFRQLCYQVGISSYPTVMLYHGADRNYQGDEIPSQSAEHIIAHIEHVLLQYHHQQSHLPHDEF
jgi:DnaJ family protein C protein 10